MYSKPSSKASGSIAEPGQSRVVPRCMTVVDYANSPDSSLDVELLGVLAGSKGFATPIILHDVVDIQTLFPIKLTWNKSNLTGSELGSVLNNGVFF